LITNFKNHFVPETAILSKQRTHGRLGTIASATYVGDFV
jgi:hypothetical protein